VVIIFSGIRGLYQGVIIKHLETQWLTLGVVVRLLVMLFVAFLFVTFQAVTAMSGAILFLIGMFIECIISLWKGHSLLKKNYQKKVNRLNKTDVMNFYFPLVFYFVVQAILNPIIYVYLSRATEIEMSIASFS